jgi:prepilin-type processing-associated H-X9-DG protein
MLCGIQAARNAADNANCKNKLRNIALGLCGYMTCRGPFPPGCAYPFTSNPSNNRHIALSWHTSLLPFVELDQLWANAWKTYRRDPTGIDFEHEVVAEHVVSVYHCPTDPRVSGMPVEGHRPFGLTSYLGVSGTKINATDGVLYPGSAVRPSDVHDGLSNTVFVGERPAMPRGIGSAWYSTWNGVCPCSTGTQILPGGTNTWNVFFGDCNGIVDGIALRPGKVEDLCDGTHFWSLHGPGANFAFCDGSVRFLSYANAEILSDLSSRAGGELGSF